LNRALLPEDVEELERHIRDHVAAEMARGLGVEAAYQEAMEGIGDLGGLESEYRKVFWEKVVSKRGLLKELIWESTMFANYLRIAFRNLWRNKGYTSINVLGLSAGLACFVMAGWLENFAYRIDLSWWIFALAAVLAVVIAVATVSYQSIRAALTDPIQSLGYE